MQPVEQRDEVEMLSLMLLIRRFEERASQQYQAQKIGGFCHLYIGQEAVVCGAIAAVVRPDDYVITAYRDHAHAWPAARARMPAWRSFSEKRPAVRADSVGRCIFSTSEHTCMADTPSSPRTSRWPVGMAFRLKYRERRSRHALLFRRRRDQPGSFHEALNLAALYKLPVIFICENNLFAMGTSVERSTSLKQIVDRAEGYDIPG
jgi:pyruvate dehydrogenase E1 component alpha subunit